MTGSDGTRDGPRRRAPGARTPRPLATHPRWAPDLLQLSGSEDADVSFECSSSVEDESGNDDGSSAIRVTSDFLVLRGATSTTRFRADDVRAWWDAPAGAMFSLTVQGSIRRSIELPSWSHGATVHAMTRAFGPRSAPDRLSA